MKQKNKLSGLILTILILLIGISCSTTEYVYVKPNVDIELLKTTRPDLVPSGLIENPKTQKELLTNSIAYEYNMYEWQSYSKELFSIILNFTE